MDGMEGDVARKPNMQSLARTSRHFMAKSDGAELEDGDGEQSDSGVCNSSKNTTRSTSDTDLTDDWDNSREGACLDYFPSHEHTKLKPKSTEETDSEQSRIIAAAYDEVVPVSDLDSPRHKSSFLQENLTPYSESKDSMEGTEMKTFRHPRTPQEANEITRRNNNMQYDEVVNVEDDDNDDNLDGVTEHERLYGSGYGSQFTPMDIEDDEEYEDLPTAGQVLGKYRTSARKGQSVDDGIRFPMRAISVTGPRNDTTGMYDGDSLDDKDAVLSSAPAFKSEADINKSLEKLIDFTRNDREVKNMPAGIVITDHTKEDSAGEKDVSTTDTLGKKKKEKKKAGPKEDVGVPEELQETKEVSCDVNGNPLELGLSRGYSDSRNGSRLSRKLEGAQCEQRPHLGQNASHFSSLPEFQGCNSIADMQSSSEHGQVRSRNRRNKKKDEGIKAENVPGFRGNQNVDALVDFIENGKGKKKKKVPSQSCGPSSASDKNNIKKVRKPRLSGSKEGSEKGGSENGSERGDDASSKVSDFGDEKLKDSVSEGSASSDLNKEPLFLSGKTETESSNMTNDAVVDHNAYIFTDFTMAKVEMDSEFTVVGKKKKQKSPKDIHCKESSLGFDLALEEGRSRRPHRSVTPPPMTRTRDDKQHERAFSPSAFPVLSGRPREGRRNSTGTCNAPSEPTQDNSDIESVKSLPLPAYAGSSSTSSKTSGTTSPPGVAHPPSYAKIAAGVKSPKTGAIGTSVFCASSTPASPGEGSCIVPSRERRHSLDSINPEATSSSKSNLDRKHSGSTASDIVQKDNVISSKEFPAAAVLDASPLSASIPGAEEEGAVAHSTVILPGEDSTMEDQCSEGGASQNTDTPKVDNNHIASEIHLDLDADFPHISKDIPGERHKPVATPAPIPNTILTTPKNHILMSVACAEVVKKQAVEEERKTLYIEASKIHNPAVKDRSEPVAPLKAIDFTVTTDPLVTTKPPPAPKTTNNHHPRKQKPRNKPVHFLDDRLNSAPQNFNISFVYEPELESPGGSSTEVQDCVRGNNCDAVSNVGGPVVGAVCASENATPGTQSKVDSLKQSLAGMNGLTVAAHHVTVDANASSSSPAPPPPQVVSQTRISSAHMPGSGYSASHSQPQNLTHTVGASPSPSLPSPLLPGAPMAGSLPQFGDVKMASYTGHPMVNDPNFDRGYFNVEDAVLFLRREWDRIMDIKKKNPEKLIFYSRQ